MSNQSSRNIYISFLALLVCCLLLPGTVEAAEADLATEAQSGGETTETANTGMLVLDDANVYDGMKKAYKDGYTPVISKDKVKIVLPVYFSTASKVDRIQAQLDLGALEGTPFIYKNHAKTIKKSKELINDGKTEKEIFLVDFSVGLKKDRENGVYPVIINLSYLENGEQMAQSFTVYVSIKDGKKGTAEEKAIEEKTEEEEKPTSEPKVIVEKCNYSTEKIVSGSTFTGTVTFKNTSKTKYIQNITVSVTSDTPGISLCSDGNVFFFDKVDADSTWELPLEIKIEEQVVEGKYDVRFSVSYDNPDATPLSSEGQISFSVHQSMKVELETGEMASEVTAGDSIALPIQVMNLGHGMIYNVRCEAEGTGLTSAKSLFIGNLEGGTAGSGELILFAGMVNANAEKEADRYGSAYGNIIMKYEDAEGNVYTKMQEYSTDIAPLAVKNTDKPENAETENTIGGQVAAGAVVVALLLAGSVLAPLIGKRRKEMTQGKNDEQENI